MREVALFPHSVASHGRHGDCGIGTVHGRLVFVCSPLMILTPVQLLLTS